MTDQHPPPKPLHADPGEPLPIDDESRPDWERYGVSQSAWLSMDGRQRFDAIEAARAWMAAAFPPVDATNTEQDPEIAAGIRRLTDGWTEVPPTEPPTVGPPVEDGWSRSAHPGFLWTPSEPPARPMGAPGITLYHGPLPPATMRLVVAPHGDNQRIAVWIAADRDQNEMIVTVQPLDAPARCRACGHGIGYHDLDGPDCCHARTRLIDGVPAGGDESAEWTERHTKPCRCTGYRVGGFEREYRAVAKEALTDDDIDPAIMPIVVRAVASDGWTYWEDHPLRHPAPDVSAFANLSYPPKVERWLARQGVTRDERGRFKWADDDQPAWRIEDQRGNPIGNMPESVAAVIGQMAGEEMAAAMTRWATHGEVYIATPTDGGRPYVVDTPTPTGKEPVMTVIDPQPKVTAPPLGPPPPEIMKALRVEAVMAHDRLAVAHGNNSTRWPTASFFAGNPDAIPAAGQGLYVDTVWRDRTMVGQYARSLGADDLLGLFCRAAIAYWGAKDQLNEWIAAETIRLETPLPSPNDDEITAAAAYVRDLADAASRTEEVRVIIGKRGEDGRRSLLVDNQRVYEPDVRDDASQPPMPDSNPLAAKVNLVRTVEYALVKWWDLLDQAAAWQEAVTASQRLTEVRRGRDAMFATPRERRPFTLGDRVQFVRSVSTAGDGDFPRGLIAYVTEVWPGGDVVVRPLFPDGTDGGLGTLVVNPDTLRLDRRVILNGNGQACFSVADPPLDGDKTTPDPDMDWAIKVAAWDQDRREALALSTNGDPTYGARIGDNASAAIDLLIEWIEAHRD